MQLYEKYKFDILNKEIHIFYIRIEAIGQSKKNMKNHKHPNPNFDHFLIYVILIICTRIIC